jgi:hypothetical protein
MSNNDFDLTDLREVIIQKYKPMQLGIGEGRSVRLRQVARLTDDEQTELIEMQGVFNELQEDGRKLNAGAVDVTPEQIAEWKQTLDHEPSLEEVDAFKRAAAAKAVSHEDVRAFKKKTVETLEKMLRLVAVNAADGEAVVAACDHDELLLMEVFTRYSKRTQLGEASASSSSSDSTAGQSSTTSASPSDSTSGQ